MTYDKNTEARIASLLPLVQDIAREFLDRLNAMLAENESGISGRIVSGTRTFEQQDELYQKGRTRPGPKVTNAPAGHSNHNYGVAFDVGLFTEDGEYIDDLVDRRQFRRIDMDRLYKVYVGGLAREMGLIWGGLWSNEDPPHVEFRPTWAGADWPERDVIAGLRERHENGQDLLT